MCILVEEVSCWIEYFRLYITCFSWEIVYVPIKHALIHKQHYEIITDVTALLLIYCLSHSGTNHGKSIMFYIRQN